MFKKFYFGCLVENRSSMDKGGSKEIGQEVIRIFQLRYDSVLDQGSNSRGVF